MKEDLDSRTEKYEDEKAALAAAWKQDRHRLERRVNDLEQKLTEAERLESVVVLSWELFFPNAFPRKFMWNLAYQKWS